MRLGRAKFVILLVCFSLACTVSQVLAGKKDKRERGIESTTLLRGAPCTR